MSDSAFPLIERPTRAGRDVTQNIYRILGAVVGTERLFFLFKPRSIWKHEKPLLRSQAEKSARGRRKNLSNGAYHASARAREKKKLLQTYVNIFMSRASWI